MATPYDLLKTENEQLKIQLANREQQLIKAKQVHDIYKEEKRQSRDLLFALMHTIGPKVHITIENFTGYIQNAQFDGTLDIDEVTGTFTADLMFYPDGMVEHYRKLLYVGDHDHSLLREKFYFMYLDQEATPEEAYTMAIENTK